MQRTHILIAGVVAAIVVIVALGIFFIGQRDSGSPDAVKNQEVSVEEPIDIATDFYLAWLAAARSTSTSPYTLGLHENPILSASLREALLSAQNRGRYDIDPVLCQTSFPDRVTSRVVSEQPESMRILVMAREDELTAQSVFTLQKLGEGWYMDSIACSPGEFEAPREFTFEKEGRLLKSVPPPLDPQYWHLVFDEAGEPGHFVPLFFGDESRCTSFPDDVEGVCNPDQFMEVKKVFLRGQMTETGVEVRRLEFLE